MQELIADALLLIRVFDRWPSFHDAEVVRIVLDRSGPHGPTLEVQIHVWETTGEVNARGEFVTRRHSLVSMLFSGIELEWLDHFNHQNVLFDLKVSSIDPGKHEGCRLKVEMSSSHGVSAKFGCVTASVLGVRPYETVE